MNSRMNKYHEENSSLSRVSKNKDLYKGINDTELDNFSVKSNVTVLGTQERDIDVEKLKKILDNKYKDTTKRKSIRIAPKEEVEEESILPSAKTKEYDLNSFLAKAKDDKEETYTEARAKKLKDTQFDILNNLHLDDEKETLPDENQDEDLMNLINTITINEVKKNEKIKPKETVEEIEEKIIRTSTEEVDEIPYPIDEEEEDLDPLNLFEDLKGDENTEIYEGIKEEIEKIEKTSKILEVKNNTSKRKQEESKKDEEVDKTFFTTTNSFKEGDFEDDDNFLDDEKMGIGVKILIVILILSFAIGLFVFLKSFLKF